MHPNIESDSGGGIVRISHMKRLFSPPVSMTPPNLLYSLPLSFSHTTCTKQAGFFV